MSEYTPVKYITTTFVESEGSGDLTKQAGFMESAKTGALEIEKTFQEIKEACMLDIMEWKRRYYISCPMLYSMHKLHDAKSTRLAIFITLSIFYVILYGGYLLYLWLPEHTVTIMTPTAVLFITLSGFALAIWVPFIMGGGLSSDCSKLDFLEVSDLKKTIIEKTKKISNKNISANTHNFLRETVGTIREKNKWTYNAQNTQDTPRIHFFYTFGENHPKIELHFECSCICEQKTYFTKSRRYAEIHFEKNLTHYTFKEISQYVNPQFEYPPFSFFL